MSLDRISVNGIGISVNVGPIHRFQIIDIQQIGVQDLQKLTQHDVINCYTPQIYASQQLNINT